MKPSATFAAAYALDLLAGDPRWLPHPVRMMGRAITAGELWLRYPASSAQEIAQGAVLTGLIVGGAWATSHLVTRYASAAGEVALGWTTLATRSLLDESGAVLDALECGDLETARHGLSMIVGRDTDSLDEPQILRAVIETVAESLCDGVIAPLFYLAIGGAPLALAYKAVNTLDSMIGHREAPYLYFGRTAARLDDAANFLPARITALAIVAAAVPTDVHRAWTVFQRDGGKHPSPNAGRSEAAMAGALGVRLGGLNYYQGVPSPKPLLGAEGRTPSRADARRALRIAGIASMLVFSAAWCILRWRERTA